MTSEYKRGYPRTDWQARKEAEELRGVSWSSWKSALENRLQTRGLAIPNTGTEKILHEWFVLRHRRKLGEIDEPEFHQQKEAIFQGKGDDFFEDPAVSFSIRFITEKTEKVSG